MSKARKIEVLSNEIAVRTVDIEFLGIWEHFNNPDFKPVEFDGFRKQAASAAK